MIAPGQVHLPAQFTLPLLLLAAAVIGWYWWRLGRDDVPPSRRRIRRLSTGLMAMALPVLGKALSFVDPAVQAQHREYVVTWTAVLLFVVAILVTAAVDVMNNLRLHHAAQVEDMHEAAGNLRKALKQYRSEQHAASGRDVPPPVATARSMRDDPS